jgi:hypothetical protein
MQTQHRLRVVKLFAGVGGLVPDELEALNGFPRGFTSHPGVNVRHLNHVAEYHRIDHNGPCYVRHRVWLLSSPRAAAQETRCDYEGNSVSHKKYLRSQIDQIITSD